MQYLTRRTVEALGAILCCFFYGACGASDSDAETSGDPCETVCTTNVGGQGFTCSSPAGQTSVSVDGSTENGCAIKYNTGGGYRLLTIDCAESKVCQPDGSVCVPATFGSNGTGFAFDTSGLQLAEYYYPTGPNSCEP